METDQIKLLKELAERLNARKLTKKEALASLHSAGILTKKGEFTKHYPNLRDYYRNK
jgi:predicted transcriptional regulator